VIYHRPNQPNYPIACNLLLIFRPADGDNSRRLGWSEHTVTQQLAQGSLHITWLRLQLATWKLQVRYSPTRPLAPTEAHGCEQLAQSCYPVLERLGVELTISQSRLQCPNHCTTKPPQKYKQLQPQNYHEYKCFQIHKNIYFTATQKVFVIVIIIKILCRGR